MYRNVSDRERQHFKRRGRRKTDAYLAWSTLAGIEINKQFNGERISGPVKVEILVRRRTRRDGDIDNRLKASIDLLVRHGVIDDDRNVTRAEAEWIDSSNMTGAEIYIEPYSRGE